ncbi:MPV17 [Mytilus edulis]|uniref:MPV17 n=1 Tax=Mytilus edulis TaxID=6550 RepID=A0A8S3TPR2_MYTED|nr:MPV17 [Mytilus edulis]
MAQLFKKVFSKYLVVTNTVTCGCLLGAGDLLTQNIEQRFMHRKTDESEGVKINWSRTERFIKGTGNKMVFKKILADQLVAGPWFCSSFFFGMGLLEGRGVEGAVGEVKENFLPVYLVDWCFWPPAQFINFKYVPLEYRVVFVCTLTLCWNTFLSYMKHRHGDYKVEAPAVPVIENTQS